MAGGKLYAGAPMVADGILPSTPSVSMAEDPVDLTLVSRDGSYCREHPVGKTAYPFPVLAARPQGLQPHTLRRHHAKSS